MALVFANQSAAAQTAAQLTGRITAANDAVVAGAQIRIADTDAGVTRTAMANGEGIYVITRRSNISRSSLPGAFSSSVQKPRGSSAISSRHTPSRPPNDELIRNQMRCLISIDEGVGRVLKALEETGQLDNTVVVFTSDNGYFWGEHGQGDKRAAYEESIRAPLFVRYPKLIKAGTAREQAALNVDIARNAAGLAGAPIPKEMHGRSPAPRSKR